MAKAKQASSVHYLSQPEIPKTKELLYICTPIKINRTEELQGWLFSHVAGNVVIKVNASAI